MVHHLKHIVNKCHIVCLSPAYACTSASQFTATLAMPGMKVSCHGLKSLHVVQGALAIVHSSGIVHADVKLENIMMRHASGMKNPSADCFLLSRHHCYTHLLDILVSKRCGNSTVVRASVLCPVLLCFCSDHAVMLVQ